MMLPKWPLIAFIFISASLRCQNASPAIDLKAINFSLIESDFIQRLNAMRAGMKLDVLVNDEILDKAASDQAGYQMQKHFLTHDQTIKGKEKPQNRVFFYKGTHDMVGENCIKIPLKIPYKPKYSKKDIEVKTYADAGLALFMGWKNSPGHYKNMIAPEYDVYGLGFSFDKDSSYLYCAQVFAAKPFAFGVEMLSPPDAFGVKEALPQSCSMFSSVQAVKALKTFQISLKNDSVYIRSEEADLLMKFFNGPADAIYFDLVQRKQFVCDKNNLLHGSPVHDGKMLAPVLFKDIFKRNRIRDGKNMFAAVCKMPYQLKDKNVTMNYGFVKNGFSCGYTYIVYTPENNLQMLDLYPKWIYQPDREIQADSFNGNLSFTIPFERGEVKLNEKMAKQLKEKLEIYRPFIKRIDLRTFSSVEGNSQVNLKLQQQRASNIMSVVKNYYNDSMSIQTQATENWDDFFTLVRYTPLAYLMDLPKDKIKERLKSKPLLDSLDFLLRISRSAELTVHLKALINNDSDPYLILAAYQKSIAQQDSLKAFINQNKLLEYVTKLRFESRDLLPVEIPLTRKFLPHLTNYLAVSIKGNDMPYSSEIRNMALQAAKIDENYLPVKFNLCIIALKYMQKFNDTIIAPADLEMKMNDCFKLGTAEDSIIVSHMWLNYSILSVYMNWERHMYHNIDKHLKNIKKYYPGAHINENEAVALGLLFNRYARHDWTLELLYPYMRDKSKNEELVFLYVQTYGTEGRNIPKQEWEKFLKKAHKMNPERFYKWINEDNFQLLRSEPVKKEFCSPKNDQI